MDLLESDGGGNAQFAAHEDFDRYPSEKEEDREKLRKEGCDAVFEPQSLYSNGNKTYRSETENDLSFVVGNRQPDNSAYQTYVTVGQQHQRCL